MTGTHVFTYFLTENDDTKVILKVKDMWDETADNKVYEIPTKLLSKFMEEFCWDDGGGRKISPKFVIATNYHPDSVNHYMRILDCDLSFPILVMGDEEKMDVTLVCDGMHRLAHAVSNNLPTIKAKFLSLEQHDRCVEKSKETIK